MTTTATGLRAEPVLPAPRGPLSAGLVAALASGGRPASDPREAAAAEPHGEACSWPSYLCPGQR
jgi:hypothetical protein